jgi:hypothetical protein
VQVHPNSRRKKIFLAMQLSVHPSGQYGKYRVLIKLPDDSFLFFSPLCLLLPPSGTPVLYTKLAL